MDEIELQTTEPMCSNDLPGPELNTSVEMKVDTNEMNLSRDDDLFHNVLPQQMPQPMPLKERRESKEKSKRELEEEEREKMQ